jgi:hypothetical protein
VSEDDTPDPPEGGLVINLLTGKPLSEDPDPAREHHAGCYHARHGWSINTRARTLKCQRCLADIDPFEALDAIAREFDTVRIARKEHARLSAVIKGLRAEEARVKARTRSASRKDADVAVKAALDAHARKMDQIQKWADEIGMLSDRINNATGLKTYSRRRKLRRRIGE